MLVRVLLILCALVAPLLGQEQDVVRMEQWRVMQGDDPGWSAPEYDDSAWAVTTWPRRHTTQQAFFAGTRWYRTSVTLPRSVGERPLAIAVAPLDEVYDVFVNGIRVGTHGRWDPVPEGPFPSLRWFAIPQSALTGTRLQVAIRRWTGRTRTNYASVSPSGSLLAPHAPEIGPADIIHLRQELRQAASINSHLANIAVFVVLLLAGLLSLGLYLARQGSRENLWLGWAMVFEAAPPLLGLIVLSAGLPIRSPIAAMVVGLQVLSAAVWIFLLASLYPKLAKALVWMGAANVAIAGGVALSYAGVCDMPYALQTLGAWSGGLVAGAIAVALLLERRGGETVWLAAVLLLQTLTHFWFTQAAAWFGVADDARYLQLGIFRVDPRTVAKLIFAVVAICFLYRRHRREQLRQSLLDRDLAEARLVQESLMAGRKASAAGFSVDAVYLPANEVGGDFYQELAGPDGSLLVLVGDVSGKGMRAALLVGHISGALANERSRRPAEVLANLNQCLLGRVSGGFVTCCCVRFDADGLVTVANAGHLAPYAGGHEVTVESGLPLGVVGGTTYAETEMRPAGQFLLLSDGVVEAENAARELFGFERTREMSGKTAAEIAEAARAWGQNDDITVVTVQSATVRRNLE